MQRIRLPIELENDDDLADPTDPKSATGFIRSILGDNVFEPWADIRDDPAQGPATLGAIASEASEQSVQGTASAIGAALGEERRARLAEWKAGVDASLDLPDPTDLDAMLPEIAEILKQPVTLPPLSVKDFDKAHPYIILPKEVAPRGPLHLEPTYAKERAILDDMFDFDTLFKGLKLVECEDPLDKIDVEKYLWHVRLPGQEKFVPPDQREELPSETLELDISKLPECDPKVVDDELNRRWETLRAELLKVEETECEDGKIVDETDGQDATIDGGESMKCEDEKTLDEPTSTPSTLVIAPSSPAALDVVDPTGQENLDPPDQSEEMPSESQEELKSQDCETSKALEDELNRKWESFRTELIRAGRTEEKVVDEAGDRDTMSNPGIEDAESEGEKTAEKETPSSTPSTLVIARSSPAVDEVSVASASEEARQRFWANIESLPSEKSTSPMSIRYPTPQHEIVKDSSPPPPSPPPTPMAPPTKRTTTSPKSGDAKQVGKLIVDLSQNFWGFVVIFFLLSAFLLPHPYNCSVVGGVL